MFTAWIKALIIVGLLAFCVHSCIGQIEGKKWKYLPVTQSDTGMVTKANIRFLFNGLVATIDTANVITIPRGWQWVLIIRDGQVWAFDSTQKRNVSRPEFFKWRLP